MVPYHFGVHVKSSGCPSVFSSKSGLSQVLFGLGGAALAFDRRADRWLRLGQ
jgi:hypothetical protein